MTPLPETERTAEALRLRADFKMDVPIGDGKETIEKAQSTLEMVASRAHQENPLVDPIQAKKALADWI